MSDGENEIKEKIEKITSGIISYLNFIKNFKEVHEDHVISTEGNNEINYKYIFREFNLEFYIIDKNYFDVFRSAINFNDLIGLLNPINEENKKIFKNELKKILSRKPYKFEGENFKVYSELEEMKKVVKNLNNYTFVNKELLCDAMGIPEIYLKDKMFKISKNKNDTCLISISNNFTLTINFKKKEEIKEYKNLYYVGDKTKRIFTLLYLFNENLIQSKIKKEIKDEYNFQTYYLINKYWMNEYKEFFLYDNIIAKLKKILKKNIGNYTYKKVKFYLDDIVKNIGQIKLYSESYLSHNIRDGLLLIPEFETKRISMEINDELETPDLIEYYIPSDFCIINKDIFELLEKEEFFYNMNDNVRNKLKFDILFGNGKLIIKNHKREKINKNLKDSKEYLIYAFNNKKNFEKKVYLKQDYLNEDESFILNYIFYYFQNDESFLKNLNKKNGFKELTKYLDINKIKYQQKIKDEKRNVLGNFISLRTIEENINNDNNDTNDNNIINNSTKFNYNKKVNNNFIIIKNDTFNINEVKNEANIMEIIKDIINKNKDVNKYLNLEYKDIKQFYLINNNWLNSKLDSFKPKFEKTSFGYEYPTDFEYIDIQKGKLIKILSKEQDIVKDICIKQMFFVYDKKNYKNKEIYCGIFDNNKNNKIIYFYFFTNEKLIFKFLLDYDNDNIMESEMKKITQKGIIKYLDEMGIDFYKKEKQYLIDLEFKKLGLFFNNYEKIENNDNIYYSRPLERNEGSYKYNDIIQCLVNIGPLKDLFLNRNKLYKEKIIEENKKITFNFYKLMQYMWHWDPIIINNDDDQSMIFMIEIISLFNNNLILNDIKLLIEFILLSMHCETKLININNNINKLRK